MLIFIDESGDPGFKITKGSSPFFVISCLIFQDESEAKRAADSIKKLRVDLKLKPYREFKFNKSNKEIRIGFLHRVNAFNFAIRSIVIDKSLIKSTELNSSTEAFYTYLMKLLLRHSEGTIKDAKIRIDGSGSREFKQNFTAYLRKELNNQNKIIMKNCKFIDSKEDDLIQMVDMIVGSIRRSYEAKADAAIYKNIIKDHIIDEWQFK